MITKNMLIMHNSWVYITFKWIKDNFKYTPFSLLKNIQWVAYNVPFSYFLRDFRVLVLRFEYLSAYRFRLPHVFSQNNISSPRLVFIQLVTIPKKRLLCGWSRFARAVKSIRWSRHAGCYSGSRKLTRLCCRSCINVRSWNYDMHKRIR